MYLIPNPDKATTLGKPLVFGILFSKKDRGNPELEE
jgi:hypothetical protein